MSRYISLLRSSGQLLPAYGGGLAALVRVLVYVAEGGVL